jgi:hypothetical protein
MISPNLVHLFDPSQKNKTAFPDLVLDNLGGQTAFARNPGMDSGGKGFQN